MAYIESLFWFFCNDFILQFLRSWRALRTPLAVWLDHQSCHSVKVLLSQHFRYLCEWPCLCWRNSIHLWRLVCWGTLQGAAWVSLKILLWVLDTQAKEIVSFCYELVLTFSFLYKMSEGSLVWTCSQILVGRLQPGPLDRHVFTGRSVRDKTKRLNRTFKQLWVICRMTTQKL